MSTGINFANYCVCFIDLLGQKDAMKGEGLLPIFKNSEEEQAFIEKAKKSVGSIISLQKSAQHFLKEYPNQIIKVEELSEDEKKDYEEMKRIKMTQQRWSDGLVFFSIMHGKAPMNAIWEIFSTAGCLCLVGLAGQKPLRGGIEISWGVELHPGELYGPAVANSYNLENTVAQYPRIVVGNYTVNYLKLAAQHTPIDKVEAFNCSLAKVCLQMISLDVDGYSILDYLGEAFTEAFTKDASKELYKKAYSYASSQLDLHSKNRNSKLAVRYNWLLSYMEAKGAIHA